MSEVKGSKPEAYEVLVEPTETQVSISKHFGYTPQEIAVIQSNVAKGTTKVELAYFINVCKSVGLNPFVKEIWCYKDNKNNLLVFAGRDGFLSKAQTNPNYAGIRSSEVCEKDQFSMDIANNVIKHSPNYKEERGRIVGAYALVFRKNGEPTIEWADFSVYNKGHNTWKTHPAEMIKKVAETHALKKAFGISGIQSEYDFEVKNDIAKPIEMEQVATSEELLKRKIIKALNSYKGDDIDLIRTTLMEKEANNEFTQEFGINILNQLENGN